MIPVRMAADIVTNKNQAVAIENYRRHDPSSPLLIDNVLPSDIISESKQVSFLV